MKFLQNEPLAKHTSLKVGGLAKLFCVPKNVEELRAALTLEEKKLVIGNGTNLIFSDEGFSGLVICLADFCTSIKVDGETAIAGAGVALNKLVNTLAENELVGLEFLAGIPGTVGGALIMNAGAWGGEIGRFVESVKVVDYQGEEKVLTRGELTFSYRASSISGVVVEVIFKLKHGASIKLIEECRVKRQQRHPLDLPNCGSVFKNPPGKIAAKLIEEAGCKGLRVGDAQISEKHANFIVNLGGATSQDVVGLISLVRQRVADKFALFLEPEVIIVKPD